MSTTGLEVTRPRRITIVVCTILAGLLSILAFADRKPVRLQAEPAVIPVLETRASCAFRGGIAEVCFDLGPSGSDDLWGGADELATLDWCLSYPPDQANFDCESARLLGDGMLDGQITCQATTPECQVRFSLARSSEDFALRSGPMACVRLTLEPDADSVDLTVVGATAKDVLGNRFAMHAPATQIHVDDCCRGDCNGDGQINMADAVSVLLEVGDGDGAAACETS